MKFTSINKMMMHTHNMYVVFNLSILFRSETISIDIVLTMIVWPNNKERKFCVYPHYYFHLHHKI